MSLERKRNLVQLANSFECCTRFLLVPRRNDKFYLILERLDLLRFFLSAHNCDNDNNDHYRDTAVYAYFGTS